MAATSFLVDGSDGSPLVGYHWATDAPERGVVVLAHGLGEHSLRYQRVAEALAAAGFHVVAVDHRGHGATIRREEELGSFGPGGFDTVVDDYARVVEQASAHHPGLPVVALGHSLGSFVVQTYLLDHSDRVVGAVLSGSAALDELAVLLDPTAPVDLAMFNAAFQPARTDFDWLSRDPAEVDAYIADPLCGFGLDPAGVASLKAAAPRTGDVTARVGVALIDVDDDRVADVAGRDGVDGGASRRVAERQRGRMAALDGTAGLGPRGQPAGEHGDVGEAHAA